MAAQGIYRFKSYGPDQGLTNLATNGITQDSAGYIWVATEGGAFRYDGQRFLRFAQADGLADALVTDIQALPGGVLLAFTASGPFRFDGTRFQPLKAGTGVDFKATPRVVQAPDGSLLMGTFSGLSRSTDGGWTFERVPNVPPGAITALWVDPRGGEILAAQREGVPGDGQKPDYHLLRGNLVQGSWGWVRQDLPAPLNQDRYDAIVRDRRGHLWARGPSRLIRIVEWGGRPEDMSAGLPGQPNQSTATLCLEPGRSVWAPTDSGLAAFDGSARMILGEANGLPTPWANVLFVDREGSLWVGSEGVHRLQGAFLWKGFNRKQGLPADGVWSMIRDRQGRLWVATPRGLARREGEAFVNQPETASQNFFALAEDVEGGIWAGGSAEQGVVTTLFHLAPGARRFERVAAPTAGSTTVSSLAADPSGGLWLGTASAGLHRLVRQKGAWASERVQLPGGTATQNIARVMVDREGGVWAAGTLGISYGGNSGWTRLTQAEGLKESYVSTLTQDANGRVWVGYWNVHGLTRLEHGKVGWRVAGHLDAPARLFNDDIVSLQGGKDGSLWLGTTGGVKRWKDGRFEHFGRSRGLPGEDCMGGALWLDETGDTEGDVWAGTSSGIAFFDHRNYHGALPAPRARLTGVKDGSGGQRAIGERPIQVPYRFRSIDFTFECLSFLDETHLLPQVRLVGFEDTWRDAENRATRYTTLPPGTYTFEARFVDADQQEGPVASQVIVILRPWWQSWWFLTLVGLSAAGLVYLVIQWRTRMLHQRTLELERLVELRTRDLQTANVALEEASMLDVLTGLKNRRYLGLHMPEEETRVLRAYRSAAFNSQDPKSEDLVLLLVDLDHFKHINDTYGHAAGDAVLRQAAQVLRGACREADTVARWGGEEFLVVARRADRSTAGGIARKIHDAFFNHPFELPDGGVVRRTCSVGFVVYPLLPWDPGAFHWEEALEVADRCLYAAKHSGRDAWVGVSAQPDGPRDMGSHLLLDLPELVEQGQLELQSSIPVDRLYWTS